MRKRCKRKVRPLLDLPIFKNSRILAPIEEILDGLYANGTVDTINGVAVFVGADEAYKIAPALNGLIDYISLYCQRRGIKLDLSPLQELSRQILHCATEPVQYETLVKCRALLPTIHKVANTVPIHEAHDLLNTVMIKARLEDRPKGQL